MVNINDIKVGDRFLIGDNYGVIQKTRDDRYSVYWLKNPDQHQTIPYSSISSLVMGHVYVYGKDAIKINGDSIDISDKSNKIDKIEEKPLYAIEVSETVNYEVFDLVRSTCDMLEVMRSENLDDARREFAKVVYPIVRDMLGIENNISLLYKEQNECKKYYVVVSNIKSDNLVRMDISKLFKS